MVLFSASGLARSSHLLLFGKENSNCRSKKEHLLLHTNTQPIVVSFRWTCRPVRRFRAVCFRSAVRAAQEVVIERIVLRGRMYYIRGIQFYSIAVVGSRQLYPAPPRLLLRSYYNNNNKLRCIRFLRSDHRRCCVSVLVVRSCLEDLALDERQTRGRNSNNKHTTINVRRCTCVTNGTISVY